MDDVTGIQEGGAQGCRRAWLPFQPELGGRPGFLHGGAIAGFLSELCDEVLKDRGKPFRSLSSSVQFLRGAREATLFAEAGALHVGAASATIQARAWQDSADRPVALIVRKYCWT
jgi:acyl-coenzyme A thioesterase PaaI-like protein